MNSFVLFLAALQGITVGAAIGWSFSVPRLLSIGMALFMVVLGNEAGKGDSELLCWYSHTMDTR
jgi:hypothetical protein